MLQMFSTAKASSRTSKPCIVFHLKAHSCRAKSLCRILSVSVAPYPHKFFNCWSTSRKQIEIHIAKWICKHFSSSLSSCRIVSIPERFLLVSIFGRVRLGNCLSYCSGPPTKITPNDVRQSTQQRERKKKALARS